MQAGIVQQFLNFVPEMARGVRHERARHQSRFVPKGELVLVPLTHLQNSVGVAAVSFRFGFRHQQVTPATYNFVTGVAK